MSSSPLSLSLRIALTSAVALAIALACACDKGFKAGGPCPPEVPALSGICLDDSSFLMCDANRRLAPSPMACKGPKGCFGSLPGKLKDSCDISANSAGDVCFASNAAADCASTDRVCSPDNKSMVTCACGKPPLHIEVIPCHGAKACYTADNGVAHCDNEVAVEGDFCDNITLGISGGAAVYTCSDDKRTMLGCSPTHKWTKARSCRGPTACTIRHGVKEKIAECDASVAEAGDPCELEGLLTCTVDRKSSLLCKRGKFVEEATCTHPCTAVKVEEAYEVTCDGDGGASPFKAPPPGLGDGGVPPFPSAPPGSSAAPRPSR